MKTSRRTFLAGAGAVAATAATQPAFAQNAIDDILSSNQRGTWNDQFDAKASAQAGKVVSTSPIFSPETVSHIEQTLHQYQDIVARGGWAAVPSSKALRLGVNDRDVEALRRRLIASGDLSERAGISQSFDTYVDAALKRFQTRHGLPADGVTGRYTYAALNISAPVRLGQLETNLVRLRSMSGFLGDRYVMVNIPAAQIEAVESNRVAQRHTAIVGKIDRQTPILNSKIHEININPYWNAPESIVRRDIIPLMRKNPNYLAENNIRILGPNGEVDPMTIDWSTDEAAKLRFRQDPGRINAMATIKINFHNPHAVYLHDTPQQSLFNNLMRFDSSGCVRVQNVRDLVAWILRDTPGWDRRRIEQTIQVDSDVKIPVANPVPIYMTYISAWATGDGVAHFRDDIYGRDGVDELQISTL
ncbi:L,D-transpeptidase family protein [Aerobium aerolatum]|uniref:Murein L,D-transpeptidase YcbB/YkuD n=1 Tax=Aquamicrobium aerolatum DSM 21857 TaxID=1121003 RepID=A0A1I3NDJ3_9HYPH|nr:L,D-transpeptidase family protein [Aquamicrobium aerolatum]SFJ07393.1 Murein L,D-transpeptidase YcbB/YkuD [Aquamicrobium aerolatum DSM 21857]